MIGVPAPKKTQEAPAAPSAAEKQSAYAQQLADISQFSSYGPVLNSSANPVQLTENETEYQITCVKHIFSNHIVFQVSASKFTITPIIDHLKHSLMYPIHCRTRFWNKFPSSCNRRRKNRV